MTKEEIDQILYVITNGRVTDSDVPFEIVEIALEDLAAEERERCVQCYDEGYRQGKNEKAHTK